MNAKVLWEHVSFSAVFTLKWVKQLNQICKFYTPLTFNFDELISSSSNLLIKTILIESKIKTQAAFVITSAKPKV